MIPTNTDDYKAWLGSIKGKILESRSRAAFSVNQELISLYWYLGSQIAEKQKKEAWGSGFIDQFSRDLKAEFPETTGFSSKNLRYCRALFNFYGEPLIWQQAVAKLEQSDDFIKWQQAVAKMDSSQIENIILGLIGQIPWGHNIHVFTKSKSFDEAYFYIRETVENGWSRDVLALQIKSQLYSRQGRGISNFDETLPEPQSDLAQQTLKDPYAFDFLTLTGRYNEREIETQLVNHITKFLLELGKGFAFIGRQYHLEVGDNDYYLDLLFYHTKLKCYVVVELKNTRFVPEYAGKLNFYLSAVDSLLKTESDHPTIGMLLCRDKNKIETEFALRDINKPIGVSEFTLTEILPEQLKGSLPTVEEIEADLNELGETQEES